MSVVANQTGEDTIDTAIENSAYSNFEMTEISDEFDLSATNDAELYESPFANGRYVMFVPTADGVLEISIRASNPPRRRVRRPPGQSSSTLSKRFDWSDCYRDSAFERRILSQPSAVWLNNVTRPSAYGLAYPPPRGKPIRQPHCGSHSDLCKIYPLYVARLHLPTLKQMPLFHWLR